MQAKHGESPERGKSKRRSEDRFSSKMFHQYNELFQVGQIITSEIDYDILFDVIIKQTNKIMAVERCSIFLIDEKGEMLNAFASAGIGGLAIQVPKSAGIVGWVFNNREPAIVNNVYKDTRFYSEIDKKSELQTKNILCVPLINRKKECIGALEIVNKKDGDFTNDDQEVLTHLSNYVAIALENARLYRELKMMDRAKERVINHLAHELKTPISVLSGVIGHLSKKLKKYDSAKTEKLKKMGLRNVQRLMDIQEKVMDIVEYRPVEEKEVMINLIKQAAGVVSDYMEEEKENKNLILKKIFDRIESIYKFGETRYENISLKDFIENVVTDVLAQSHRKKFDIQKDLDDTLTLYMDSNFLRKILFGLIKNAIENTPDGGKIQIKVYKTDNNIVIDCIDHGVGITRENREQIFGGFFHTQETEMYSTKKPFDFDAGGAGIDLLRTKILSEQFGYTLNFVSKRCDFIILDSNKCPGNIAMCPHIKNKEGCHKSGGSAFSIRFPNPAFA